MEKGKTFNPRPASSIILVRDHENALQVYLLRRSRKSSFFPGYYVFPGGGVDKGEGLVDDWADHVDMDMEEIERRFGGGISGKEILGFCIAGIRETFEEAGVILAKSSKAEIDNLCMVRDGEGLPKEWLKDLVKSNDWVLSLGSISRWAHWITPKLMKYHFDTRFFIAVAPEGQTCKPDLKEMEEGIWVTPKNALAENIKGNIPLSPPTVVTVNELLDYPDTEALKDQWETRGWGETRWPRLIPSKKGPAILQTWDPQWDSEEEINTDGFENLILDPEDDFSRLYLHEGIWKPVRVP